jgi:tetratricopeptide (TPR) repeat protein
MGVVYRARQHLGAATRPVAVKLLHPTLLLTAREEALARFQAELHTLSTLQHEGIARLYDGGIYDDPHTHEQLPYLAMELVRGGLPLTTYVADYALPWPERLALVERVCQAVRYAHEHRVVHRDLKPTNILVDYDGRPVVIDFGLAAACEAVLPGVHLAASGTPAYMSPEQVSAAWGIVSDRSDVYALGLLLYELLTGQHPYAMPRDASVEQVCQVIIEATPLPLRQYNPAYRGELEMILAAALAKRPAERCSVAVLRARLERYLQARPTRLAVPGASLVPSLPTVPALHQVPPPPRDFTGRTAELAEILTAMTQEGVTLCGLFGMGGIGKTALALKVTEHLAPRYPDAQLYIDLKGTSATPLSVAEAMAQVLQAYYPSASLPASEAALRGRYQSALYGQRALVLLDNAAHREQVEALLPPASCALLVTSRQYFTLPGLHAKRLTTLLPAEARALVHTIVPRLGDQADVLTALCGYLPLALRVSASTLAEHLDLSPHDYVQHLTATQQRLGLIDASLSVSFALLNPVLQQQWCLVALFPSLFDAAAAAAVLDLDRDKARDVLGTLVRSSLVEWVPDTGRYRLHDLARVFAQAHRERTRERAPLKWARTQRALGHALCLLGWREAGTAQLEEAVQACHAALQEHTRERVPLEWARTQRTLGHALGLMGEREAGTTRLEEAVQAYRAALQEHTRERVPLEWVQTQRALGLALCALGTREAETARLEEAVQVYRAVLQVCPRARVPLDWARTQQSLGRALGALGEREAGTARLEEAVQACHAALQEDTRERAPLDWARTQRTLGAVLRVWGEREAGTARLEEAVQACRAALQECPRERAPLD